MDRKYRQSRWYAGVVALLATPAFLAAPAFALDINSFRAQHKLPPLSVSGAMSAAAASHAADMAARKTLDHKGFRERMGAIASTAAENVAVISCARPDAKPDATFAGRACGCADEDCVYQMWAKSEGHKRNMLLKGITHYGIASATGEDGGDIGCWSWGISDLSRGTRAPLFPPPPKKLPRPRRPEMR